LSHGQVAFEGDTDEAIAVYMQDDMYNDTFFDVKSFVRNNKCNLRHQINSFTILNYESNHINYGDAFNFKMNWICQNDDERIKMKVVITSTDGYAVGIIHCGELNHNKGINESIFSFDTKYLVPGRYALHFKLYDEDKLGNAAYYDQCKGIVFVIEHSENSLHLKHWFQNWGNAVLPCIEQINGDDKNV
ncbi:MAG: hypothetical protein UHK54_05605, partial [Acutalibacteraceae bacterium]|nr:hypothetical protein [Acutalibacteraceae bacterium]